MNCPYEARITLRVIYHAPTIPESQKARQEGAGLPRPYDLLIHDSKPVTILLIIVFKGLSIITACHLDNL